MKWNKKIPQYADTKIVTKFLIIPRCWKNKKLGIYEWRWAEIVGVRYRYINCGCFFGRDCWKLDGFVE